MGDPDFVDEHAGAQHAGHLAEHCSARRVPGLPGPIRGTGLQIHVRPAVANNRPEKHSHGQGRQDGHHSKRRIRIRQGGQGHGPTLAGLSQADQQGG